MKSSADSLLLLSVETSVDVAREGDAELSTTTRRFPTSFCSLELCLFFLFFGFFVVSVSLVLFLDSSSLSFCWISSASFSLEKLRSLQTRKCNLSFLLLVLQSSS